MDMLLKGQSDIISAILVVLIAIGLVAVALNFGLPLIEKSQDKARAERVHAFFDPANSNSLPAKIQAVANNGDRSTASIDAGGVMTLRAGEAAVSNPNSIDFTFTTKVSKIADGIGWVSLTGDRCPGTGQDTDMGIIGVDEPAIVCARAERAGSGTYNVTYRILFRELEDAQKLNGFMINLLQHSAGSTISANSATNTVRIEFGERRTEIVGSKTLIITDVKILLV